MINTIFYYPQTLTFEEYLNQLGSEIAARTIVFAKDQKSIYMGGKKFGATSASDIADLKQYIQSLFDNTDISDKIENIVKLYFTITPQDLPTASTTKKGCIKVGDGLTMNGDTMSVDFSDVQNGVDGLDGLVEQIIKNGTNTRASKLTYGVVKVGDGIDVNNGVISVTLTQGPKGDTGPQGALGPQGERGPAGPAYDDTALQNQINALDDAIDAVNETANSEKARLDGLIEDLDSEISDRIDAMFDDAQWVQQHITIPNQPASESNFGEDDVEAYLQRIGVWEENEEHTAITTKWSKLAQTVNTLSGSVNELLTQGIDELALQAQIELKIKDGIANLDLSTIYARKQAEQVIEWLYSGLKGQANDTTTFADLVSAGKNSLHQAIADIHTYVEKLKSGDYVATASLEASVDSAIAGLKASASSNTAKTEIFNKISQNSTDIAAIVSSITNDNSQTTIANKIGTWRSGLITQANLDSAIASLLATNGTYTAGIMTEAEFNAAKTSLVAKNEYDAATIVAMINNAGSLVLISADKIDLDGKTIFDILSGSSLSGISLDGQNYVEFTPTYLLFRLTAYAGAVDNMVDIRQGHITILYGAPTYGKTIIDAGSIDLYNGSEEDHTVSIGNGSAYFLDSVSTGDISASTISISSGQNTGKISIGVIGSRPYFDFDKDASFEGDVTANGNFMAYGDITLTGDVIVGGLANAPTGLTTTVTIGDKVLTFTKGILTNVAAA